MANSTPQTTYNITTKAGATVPFLVTEWQGLANQSAPLSNVGYTGKLQVRRYSGETVIVELTAGNGLTPGGANGQTVVRFGANHTILFPVGETLRYDLRYVNNTDPTDVRYPVGGTILATATITM